MEGDLNKFPNVKVCRFEIKNLELNLDITKWNFGVPMFDVNLKLPDK